MATPFWGTNVKAWDKPTIGGKILPGVVHLKDAGVTLRIQKAKASGSDGGGLTIKGLELPDFTFEGEITSEADHFAWDALVPLLLPRRDPKTRAPLPVYHPSLARYGIALAVVKDIHEEPPRAGGPLRYKIECLAVAAKKPGATKKADPAAVAPTIPLAVTGGVPARDIRDFVRPPAAKLTKR